MREDIFAEMVAKTASLPHASLHDWHTLALVAFRQAYGGGGAKLDKTNMLLRNAPRDLRWRLVGWFTELGIEVAKSNEETGILIAVSFKRAEHKQSLERAKSLHLSQIQLPEANKHSLRTEKPWFDDLELEEMGHSVRALQGGRACGK